MHRYSKTYINNLISISSIITVYYRKLRGNGNASGEQHNFWEFQYVDEGEWRIMVGGTYHILSEGQFLLFAPNDHHCVRDERISAQVSIMSFESQSPALEALCSRVISLNARQREIITEMISEGIDMFDPSAPGSELLGMVPRKGVPSAKFQILKAKLELFLTDLYYSENSIPARGVTNSSNYHKTQFEEIERYLTENLDKNFTLEELSRKFSISPSKLKAIFKEECKTSPMDYFTVLKVNKAQQLIRDTNLSFAEIAESLGFSYSYYFSKVFKQKTGLTPTEYMRSVYKAR